MAIESVRDEHRPLSPKEQKEYDEQCRDLVILGQEHNEAAGKPWREGQLCKTVRDTGYWRRDRSHSHTELMDFLYDKAGIRSDTTMERRLALAEAFTYDEYLSHAGRGVCQTVLFEITKATSPEVRVQLLELTRRQKVTVKDIDTARKAAEDELERAAQARQVSEPSPESVQIKMEQSILARRAREEEDRQALAALNRERRGNGERSESSAELQEARGRIRELETELGERERALSDRTRALESELADKARTIAEQGAALQKKDEEVSAQRALLNEVQAEGGATPEALAQRLGELVAQRQALAQEQAAVVAQRDALRAEQAALAQERTEIAERQAQVQRDIEAAEAKIAAGKEAEETLAKIPARVSEVEAREHAVAAREEELCAREARLFESHDQLDDRQAALEEKAAELEGAAVEIKETRAQLEKDCLDLERQVVSTDAGMFRWAGHTPHGLDSLMVFLDDHLFRLYEACFRAKERFDEDEELHEEGGIAPVANTLKLIKMFYEESFELFDAVAREYADRFPERAIEEMAEWKAEQARLEDDGAPRPIAPHEPAPPAVESTFAVPIEAVVGTKNPKTPQVGLLAMRLDRKKGIAMCLNKPQVINIVGLQGKGKSSTILAFVEMMLKSIKNISKVPKEAAILYCHFGENPLENPPGVSRSDEPNSEKHGIVMLDTIGAKPEALGRRRTHFVPPMSDEDFEAYKAMYPGARVVRIAFALSDLTTRDIRLFMGAAENSSIYMGRLDDILRRLKKGATLDDLWAEILKAGFDSRQLALLEERMRRLRAYATGTTSIIKEFVPGELFVIDIRRDDVSEIEAMVVFTVMMNCFSRARNPDGSNFTKAIVLDEAHKYLSSKSGITKQVLSMIREMRHRRMWIIIASQDAKSVPETVNELSTVTVVHHIKSKDDLRVLRKGNTAWDNVTAEDLLSLEQGEVYIVVTEATDEVYQRVPQRVRIRATCCMPAGTTELAVSEDG